MTHFDRRAVSAALWFGGLLTALVPAFGDTWQIDAAHSSARFKIRHMMVANVTGEITGFKGTFTMDATDVTKLKAEATLDPATITTNNAKRDGHLKSPDFFDVAKFPTMAFKSTKVVKQSGDKFKMVGELTLHGVTQTVTLDGATLTGAVKDPMGNMRRGFSARTEINRKDFGLNWNKTLDEGGVVVGEAEVELEIEVQTPAKEVKG